MSNNESGAYESPDGPDESPTDTLTAFQQDILLTLARLAPADERSYGLAIKRRLEDRYDAEVNHGRLYPNLDQLVDADLVQKQQLDQRTNHYQLTDAGVAFLVSRRDELATALEALADGGGR